MKTPLVALVAASIAACPVWAADKPEKADKDLSLFDGKSLAGWKVTDFAGHGEVTVSDGEIRIDSGAELSGITFSKGELPKSGYEIELEAKRVEGSDFFCGLTVPVGESFCTLIVGGWGGALVGISSIDGLDASENATTQFRRLESGQWYRIRLRVLEKRITAWIDKDQVVDVDTTGKKIGLRTGSIDLSKPLGLTTFRTSAAIRKVVLHKL